VRQAFRSKNLDVMVSIFNFELEYES